MAGLTPTGFEIKRLDEIQEEIIEDFKSVFGNQINTDELSVFSLMAGVFAERLAEIWEIQQAIYNATAPVSASGVPLDHSVALSGLTRIAAAKTTAVLALEGTQGTIVPSGNQFSIASTGDTFESTAAVTIDKASTIAATLEVVTSLDSTAYTVTIDSTPYTYTSGVGESVIVIAAGVVAAMAAVTEYDITDNLNGTIRLEAADNKTGYSLAVSPDPQFIIDVLESPADVENLVTGPVTANAGSITTIVNSVAGLNTVTNYADAIVGRNVETDSELRARQRVARVLGLATEASITSKILNEVDGVSSASLIVNDTDVALPGGQPPHSIQAVVAGGADADIAQKIWDTKAAGIQTDGSLSESVTDSSGNSQTVYFSRPTSQYAHMRVTLTLNPEEEFPASGLADVAAAILAEGNTLTIGDDIILQKFVGPIYETPGIATALIEAAITSTPGGTPSYGTVNVAIDSDELAVFDASRITVT